MEEKLAAKLHEIFHRKMQEVYETNACPDPFGGRQIAEFNAWQEYLRSKPFLEVVDIEEGEKPGFVRLKGQVVGIRFANPSNAPGYSKEFVIVPVEIADRILTLEFIPDEVTEQDG